MAAGRTSLGNCLLLALLWAGAGDAATFADQPYGPATAQRLDVYTPADIPGTPAIVMVHGGGWQYGDKALQRVIENKLGHWLPRGIAVVSINYRMQPEAPPLEQARDVARALAWVQQNAGKIGVDRRQIVLMGHSAGAHLAALLAAAPELLAAAGAEPPQGYVLLDSGALDVPAIMNAPHFPLYDRAFGSDPAAWAAASPQHRLQAASAPLLAVCSSRRANACPQARAFVAKAQGFGSRAAVLAVAKSHGELNAELGADPDYTAAIESFIGGLSPGFAERLR